MALEGLVNIQGSLAKVFIKLDPETISHSYEILADMRSNKELRKAVLEEGASFWTADGAVYSTENDGTLYLTHRDFNPILKPKNIRQAVKQLLKDGFYEVEKDDLEAIKEEVEKESGKVKKINLSEMKKEGGVCSVFPSINYENEFNATEQAVTNWCYGKRSEFIKNMKLFDSLEDVGVCCFDPEYVIRDTYLEDEGEFAEHVPVRKAFEKNNAIASLSLLTNLCSNFFISLGFEDMSQNNYLQGRPKGTVWATAQKPKNQIDFSNVTEAYQTLLSNPEEAVQDMTPEIAADISKLAIDYLFKHKK